MRILVCSPGHSGKFQGFFYSFDKKLLNGFARLGHYVVHFPDRDAADGFLLGARRLGAPHANRRFLGLVDDFEPEAIVLFHADVISEASLIEARRRLPGVVIANVEYDLVTARRNLHQVLRRGEACDWTFITSGGEPMQALRDQGLRAAYVPNPTDASIENADAHAQPEHDYDLVYFSRARNTAERWRLPDAVAAAPGLRVGIFGRDRKRVYGQRYWRLLGRTRCALNWSHTNDIALYSSDRIGQLFGAGVCVCLPESAGFRRFLDDSEALFFHEAGDLADKLRAHTQGGLWREVARKGQAKYRKLFNETRVADYVLRRATGDDVSAFEWTDV